MNFEKKPEEIRRPSGRAKRRKQRWSIIAGVVLAGVVALVWFLGRPAASSADLDGSGQVRRDQEEAEQIAGRVNDLMEVADEHIAAGRMEDAGSALTEASELQREINARFARLPQASADRLREIEIERQTVQAAPLLAELTLLDAEAAGYLRKRDVPKAQQIIGPAGEAMERAAADYPLARGMEGEMRLRLGFLNRRQAELGWIQDLAREGLVSDPANPGVGQLEAGPGWELYKRVLGAGAGSTAAERKEFCRRIGWVLGLRTRLAAEGGAARSSFQVIVELEAGVN